MQTNHRQYYYLISAANRLSVRRFLTASGRNWLWEKPTHWFEVLVAVAAASRAVLVLWLIVILQIVLADCASVVSFWLHLLWGYCAVFCTMSKTSTHDRFSHSHLLELSALLSAGLLFIRAPTSRDVVVADEKCCWNSDNERKDERTKATSFYVDLLVDMIILLLVEFGDFVERGRQVLPKFVVSSSSTDRQYFCVWECKRRQGSGCDK
jgi:hypothetical protein